MIDASSKMCVEKRKHLKRCFSSCGQLTQELRALAVHISSDEATAVVSKEKLRDTKDARGDREKEF